MHEAYAILKWTADGQHGQPPKGDLELSDIWMIHGSLEASGLIRGAFWGGGWHVEFSITPTGEMLLKESPYATSATCYAQNFITQTRREHGRRYFGG